jgi:spermidine synthase
LGAAWLGRRAERSSHPLQFYGNLEVIVALCAALTPLLTQGAAQVYYALGGSRALGPVGATLVRLVLAAMVMGPATIAMGGTLPAMARAVETATDDSRERLAVLYAINTLGAVAGSLMGTFVLFEVMGYRLTLWTACSLNLLVAITARALGRRQEPLETAGPTPQAAAINPRTQDELPDRRVVYAVAALVGFCFLLLEMIWYRMLSPLLGGTTFTFGLILAVALAGIGLGGYAYARRAQHAPVTLYTLATTLGLEAFFAALPLLLGDHVALLAVHTRQLQSIGFHGLLESWTFIAMLVVFPTACVSGYQFPVIFALLGRGRTGVAHQVGMAYAFNTLGSIFGALFAGFLIVPALGAVTAWRLCAGMLALSAIACGVLALQRVRPRRLGAVALSALMAGVALMTPLATGPTSTWRHEPIGVGRANFSSLDRNQLRQRMAETQARTVWERDGRESNVQLASGVALSFSINGKSDGNVWADRGTQTLLGIVPAMLHGKAQRAFVVGLGTGMSAGWLAQLPTMQHVDVAEIEPAVVEVARAAHESNAAVLDNPKVSVFLGDAREFMLTSTDRYDVIASEPSNPYRAGIASLFTAEFYRVVAERLNPGGVFAQWVQGYEIDVATVRTVLRTLRQVFPFVEVWQTQGADFLMIGTQHAPSISRDALAQQLAEPPLQDLLPRMWLVEGVEGVLAHFIADSALTQEVSDLGNPAINTDDTNVLEYSFAHTAGNTVDDLGVVQKLAQHASATRHARPKVLGEVNWALVNELRSRAWLLGTAKAPPVQGAGGDDTLRIRAFHQGCAGDASQVFALWQQQAQTEPSDIVETYTLGLGMAVKAEAGALPLIARLEQRGFLADARLLQAELALAQGSVELGMQRLLESLAAQRQGLIPLCNVSERTLQRLGKIGVRDPSLARVALAALAQGPLVSHLRNRERIDWMERLGHATRDPVLCVQAMGRSVEHPWWDQGFLQRRYECLNAAHHPLARQAELDLLEYLTATSGTFAGSTAPVESQAPPPSADD